MCDFTITRRIFIFQPVPMTAQVSDGFGGLATQEWNITAQTGQAEACPLPGPC